MKRLALVGSLPVLAACSLAPGVGETLRVTSEPTGAEVHILGNLAGTTPLEVPLARLFPAAYPQDKSDLYGRVLLRKEGCVERQMTVSTRAVSDGLHARLSCEPGMPDKDAGDLRARLKRLAELRQDGTITEEEYGAQRLRILGEL